MSAVRGRLDDMQTAALEENRWATPEANAALDVIVGLSVIIVGLSEADEPVIDQKALHEAATIFDRLAKDLGKLSLSPETPQEINIKNIFWGKKRKCAEKFYFLNYFYKKIRTSPPLR
mgnify:CR=1 FL=1